MNTRILLIDDDNNILEPTQRLLETHGFDCCAKNNFTDGEQSISDDNFDIVITDYKDEVNKVDDAGNKIFNKLKSIKFTPIIIYTGFAGQIVDGQNSFFRIVEKDASSDKNLIEAINEIINSKEYKIKTEIEKEIDTALKDNFKEYFWEIIHCHWDDFKDINELSLKSILFRKVLKDLYPKYLENGQINSIEFYEHPVNCLDICSGAIISKNNSFFICVNNDCDLIVNTNRSGLKSCKASKISLLEIKDYSSFLCVTGSTDNQKYTNNKIINNNDGQHQEKRFFFPKTFFFRGGYVDFYDIITKELEIENGKIKLDDVGVVIAKVHAPFLQRFISNFSRCYNRFGTPVIDI